MAISLQRLGRSLIHWQNLLIFFVLYKIYMHVDIHTCIYIYCKKWEKSKHRSEKGKYDIWNLTIVFHLLSCVQLFAIPWTAAHQASLSFTISQRLLKLMSIESVMPSNHLILCGPLLFLPSVFPSIGVFSSESALRIRWPKYWSFSFSISFSNEHSVLISFRIDWFDLLAAQGALESLFQHHSLKASFLWHSAFLIVQLSNP